MLEMELKYIFIKWCWEDNCIFERTKRITSVVYILWKSYMSSWNGGQSVHYPNRKENNILKRSLMWLQYMVWFIT